MKYILLFVLLISTSLSSQEKESVNNTVFTNAEISSSVHVDSHEVPQNRTLTYSVKVRWQGDLDRFEIEKLETPTLTNLRILSNSSSNWVGEEQGIQSSVKTYRFILAPQEIGMAYIDGALILYKDRITEKSQRLVTNRIEVKVIEPIVERDWSIFIYLGLIALVTIAGFVGLSKFRKQKKQREARLLQEQAALAPIEETYLAELKQQVDLQSQNQGDHFSTISSLYRKYLSEKYQISAMGMTTSEILAKLNSQGVDSKFSDQTKEVLDVCDVAKFSGGQSDRASLERIYTIFEQNLQKNRDNGDTIENTENTEK